MPLWKIALLSYAILLAVKGLMAFFNIVKLTSFSNAMNLLKGWRFYAEAIFFTGIVLMSLNIALFPQLVWVVVFFLAIYTAIYDQFIYPKEIETEPYIDKLYLSKARLLSLANIPIYVGLYIYAFASPHIWS
nr:hypothetical protein [uncultured bacterium]